MGYAAPGRKQGLLKRVLGVLSRPEYPVAVQLHFGLIGADELAERVLVSGLHPPDQVLSHRALPPSSSPCRVVPRSQVLIPQRTETGRPVSGADWISTRSGQSAGAEPATERRRTNGTV